MGDITLKSRVLCQRERQYEQMEVVGRQDQLDPCEERGEADGTWSPLGSKANAPASSQQACLQPKPKLRQPPHTAVSPKRQRQDQAASNELQQDSETEVPSWPVAQTAPNADQVLAVEANASQCVR